MPVRAFLFLCVLAPGWLAAQDLVFIGSYTRSASKPGLYVYLLDTVTGRLKRVCSVNAHNPSFVTLAPNGRCLYACTETQTPGKGSICSYAFNPIAHTLQRINCQSSNGENPVYAAVDNTARWLVVGTYTEAGVSLYPLGADGSIAPAAQVLRFKGRSIKPHQEQAHIHSTVFSPAGDRLFFPDLGADEIRCYAFRPHQPLPLQPAAPAAVPVVPGSGPRHLTFNPKGTYAYCIDELSGFVDVYEYKAGRLLPVQHVAAHRRGITGCSSGDIHLSPDGRFLYASNRSDENNIAIFSVQDSTGRLTLLQCQATRGDHPRMFAISPSGKFLIVANTLSGTVVVFRRNAQTGLLTHAGGGCKIPGASCVQITTAGPFGP